MWEYVVVLIIRYFELKKKNFLAIKLIVMILKKILDEFQY